MAEAVINLVLNRLAEAAVKETVSLFEASDKLDSLQHELRWIRAFLKDAETKQISDERVKIWVSDVREVAYRIEDVVDMFMAEMDEFIIQPGKFNALKIVLKNPKKLLIGHKLTHEIDKIQASIGEIKERTMIYGIKELGENSSSVSTRRPIVLPDEDDPGVIGLDTDKENIVKILLDPNTTRRCVVSIVGQGGLGKTTLAKKAYNRFVRANDILEIVGTSTV